MTILLTQNLRVGGVVLNSGTTQTFGADLEADIVARKGATYLTDPTPGKTVPVFATTDVTGKSIIQYAPPVGGKKVVLLGDSRTAQNQDTSGLFNNTKAQGIYAWADAQLTGDFYFINSGVSGNKTSDVVARMQSDVVAYYPDEVWIWIGVNDILNGIPVADSIANLTSILNICRPYLVRLCTEPFADVYDTIAEKDALSRYNEFIRSTPLAWPNVAVHNIARAWDNPEQGGGTPVQTQGFASDGLGVHPNDVGAKRIADAWVKDYKSLLPSRPLTGYVDGQFATYNPRGLGSNATGVNNFLIQNGSGGASSGVGPDNWLVSCTGLTGVAVASKVAHPTEPYVPGTICKVVASFPATNDLVLIGDRTSVSFGGVATDGMTGRGFKDILQPAVRNGCSYFVLTPAGGGVLANPVNTHLWSTKYGDVVNSGTCTLRVIKEILPGTTYIEALAECYIESQVGAMQVYLYVDLGGGRSLSALLPSAPDANTKHASLPTYMRLKSIRALLPAGSTTLNSYLKFVGTAGGSANLYVPIHGIRAL